MGLQEDFDKAAEEAKHLPGHVIDAEKLKLYGLFKQGTFGDVNTSRPGMLDFVGKSKWDAWHKEKGKSKETAQQEYIHYVAELKGKYAHA